MNSNNTKRIGQSSGMSFHNWPSVNLKSKMKQAIITNSCLMLNHKNSANQIQPHTPLL